ncbi:BgTH12-01097 [Blumeria graminis f. sp. triticale]|uniref:BgTH12-01097 n=1 Tax=Blumeria graminis f. sp. triticale TaxID=1689686 RepID=A0A9W4DBX3_BLUGR|nr:BgTH12-01097 [Blumeria graminis f. sp. triticale]
MRCMLALLLLNDIRPKDNDRLITMPLNGDYKYYRIYNSKGLRQFRGVEAGSDVITAARQINSPGTHIAVYCSPSQDSRYLRKYIAEGATELHDSSQFGFHQDISQETKCLEQIEAEFRSSPVTTDIPIRKFSEKIECSKSTIYSLAFQNHFCIQNNVDEILTPFNPHRRRIAIEFFFRMPHVVLNGKLILQTEANGLQTAMAWYQGYLNIFQKKKSLQTWYPVKRSLQDTEDFDYIIDYIAESFIELRSIKSLLTQGGNTISPTPTDAQTLREDHHVNKELYIKQQLGILRQKNLRLPESIAEGLIGPFVK